MPLIARNGYQRVYTADADAIEPSPEDTGDPTPSTEDVVTPAEAENHPIIVAENNDEITETNEASSENSPLVSQIESSPPPYIEDGNFQTANLTDLDPSPPKYGDVVKLPTYEEIDLNHSVDIDEDQLSEDLQNEANRRIDEFNLGTDLHFLFAFFISFFFHVIGFMLAFCLSTTIAGRHGALSGFGLSLIKTAFLFKYTVNQETVGVWPGFLFVICGVTITVHGICTYIRAKRSARLTAPIFAGSLLWRQPDHVED